MIFFFVSMKDLRLPLPEHIPSSISDVPPTVSLPHGETATGSRSKIIVVVLLKSTLLLTASHFYSMIAECRVSASHLNADDMFGLPTITQLTIEEIQ